MSHLWGEQVSPIEGLTSTEILQLYSKPLSHRDHKSGNDFSSCWSLTAYLMERQDIFYEDVCEVFGGQGGVLRMAARRKLQGHKNFDLTCGIDLSDQAEVKALFNYLSSAKVFCVALGPPCIAFGPWASFNRRRWGLRKDMMQSMNRALRKCTTQANLVVSICEYQLSKGRHFIVGNPYS